MLGRLPTLHRVILLVAVLLSSTVLGLWLGNVERIPLLVPGATVVTVSAGLVLFWLLFNDHTDDPTRRVRRGG